ncbi:MAG: SDR family NAD(P)-dependent oxidoreductase, partial [Chitinivibrionales bacterium]|nr:SDR family NAD(P)-dependent oxidoreductase [Chitinivibrionales bacterium]
MKLEGKTAIVTGGSRGIGRAITAELALRGARVFFTYNRNEEAAQEVEQLFGATACRCSQTDAAAIEEVVSKV